LRPSISSRIAVGKPCLHLFFGFRVLPRKPSREFTTKATLNATTSKSGPATCGRIGALVVSTSDRLLVKCNLCASSWAREAFSSWFAGIGECVVRRLDGELDRDVRRRLSVFAAAQLQPVKQWGHAKSERPNHLLLCFQCSVSTTGRKSRYISPQIGSRGLAGDSPERYWRIAFRRCR